MLARLIRLLRIKKAIKFREWHSNARLAQMGAVNWVSYAR